MGAVVSLFSNLLNRMEPDFTIELDDVIYSKKHGHEICVLHVIGKNIFPKMTTDEILSNPKAMAGLSKEDIIRITRLDIQIKDRINNIKVIEMDRNGTVILQDKFEQKTYSVRELSTNPLIMDQLKGRDAFRIGYKLGFKECMLSLQQKKALIKNKLLSIFRITRSS